MSQIDISQWKEFKVGDILNINSSKYIYHARNLYIEDNKLNNKYYPYVVRTEFNNGIRGYIEEDQSTLNSGHTISLAQDTAQFFYQEEPYFTGNKIKICALNDDTVELTKNKALFLISALYKAFATFSYDSSFNVTRLNKVTIKLPVDSNGDPDWQYMDTYIAKLTALAHKNVSSLKQAKSKPAKLNIDHWGEFKVSDILSRIPVKKTSYKATDLVKEADSINTIPLVAAGVNNQGVTGYAPTDNLTILQNCLTVSANGANSGTVFYQNRRFSILQDAYALELIDKTYRIDTVYIYLASLLTKLLMQNDWTNKATWNIVKDKHIKLPIDAKGEPDWEYMDNQVRHFATLSNLTIASLRSVI